MTQIHTCVTWDIEFYSIKHVCDTRPKWVKEQQYIAIMEPCAVVFRQRLVVYCKVVLTVTMPIASLPLRDIDFYCFIFMLTQWGRVTHMCVSKIIIIASDNGLSPGPRQYIIWTNDGIMSIGPFRINFGEILMKICKSWFRNMHLKMSTMSSWISNMGEPHVF